MSEVVLDIHRSFISRWRCSRVGGLLFTAVVVALLCKPLPAQNAGGTASGSGSGGQASAAGSSGQATGQASSAQGDNAQAPAQTSDTQANGNAQGTAQSGNAQAPAQSGNAQAPSAQGGNTQSPAQGSSAQGSGRARRPLQQTDSSRRRTYHRKYSFPILTGCFRCAIFTRRFHLLEERCGASVAMLSFLVREMRTNCRWTFLSVPTTFLGWGTTLS